MLRIFLFLFCISLVTAQLSFANNTKLRMGIFIFKLDDVYINSVATAIEKELAHKVELTIFDAQNDQTKQNEQLHAYLNTNPDAVAINLVDIKISQSILNMVRTKNIPVIFFNKEPNLDIVKTYTKARYVGTDARQCSIIQGEIIAKLWTQNPEFDKNGDGVCTFIMLQGGLDNPEALLRTRVSVEEARRQGLRMQQVGDTLICDWDANCAYNATQLAFKLYSQDIEFIISNNDDMAIGAIKTLQEMGFNTKGAPSIPVVGVDAIQKAQKAIAEGSMHGTVLQDAKGMAVAVSTMLLNGAIQKPFLEGLPYTWDANGISIRIPYRAYGVKHTLGH